MLARSLKPAVLPDVEVDHVARISKAAATRVAKNAAELGMTVED